MRRLLKEEVEEYVDKLREKVVQKGNTTEFGGNIDVGGEITGNEIVEKMSGYSVENISNNWTPTYISAVKNGNKLTIVFCGNVIPQTKGAISLCNFKSSSLGTNQGQR